MKIKFNDFRHHINEEEPRHAMLDTHVLAASVCFPPNFLAKFKGLYPPAFFRVTNSTYRELRCGILLSE